MSEKLPFILVIINANHNIDPKGDDIMDLWNKFLKSGKILDYLKYKLSEEGSL